MEEERPSKRRKLFQETLPIEMIENVIFMCSNTTLESLACTCKQIRSLVSSVFNKRISVQYASSVMYESEFDNETETSFRCTITGNGSATKHKLYLRKNDRELREENLKNEQKKFENNKDFIKLHKRILQVFNMTNKAQLEELLNEYDSEHLSEFTADADVTRFDVQIDDLKIEYNYCKDKNEEKKVKKVTNEADLHNTVAVQDLSSNLDDSIRRLKCTVIVAEVTNFYRTAAEYKKQADKELSIEYSTVCPRGRELFRDRGWDFQCSTSGIVKALWYDINENLYNPKSIRRSASVQLRPSLVQALFADIEKYIAPIKQNTSTPHSSATRKVTITAGCDAQSEIQLRFALESKPTYTFSKKNLKGLMTILKPLTSQIHGLSFAHD